jgi:DNA-binding NarL/FixJ family response regulator
MAMRPTIIIADDHPLFRTALTSIVANEFGDAQLVEACDFSSLQSAVEKNNDAKLILLDLHMPGAEGFSALVHLTAHYPQIPVVIVSAHEEPEIMRRALDHGASGFLPKSSAPDTMHQAIQAVLEGKLWLPAGVEQTPTANEQELDIAEALASLTPQQFRVASMVNQGLLNKQIAYELDVTEATVKAHMTEIFRKLGVHSRIQVALTLGQLAVTPGMSTEEFKS